MSAYTPEQQRFFREHEAAEPVRRLYALHATAPQDPGAAGMLAAAVSLAKQHPDWPTTTTEKG